MEKILKKIDLIISDVDGVLTDGGIILTNRGDEIKIFNSLDGAGIKFWHRMGKIFAIITGRKSEAVLKRMQEVGIKKELIFQGYRKKIEAFEKILEITGFSPERIAYIGDDLPDLPVMKRVSLPIAVPNACEEVKNYALYITKKNGGDGAVRECIEIILKSQKLWNKLLQNY